MFKYLILFLGWVPSTLASSASPTGVSAGTIQTCEWPKTCGPVMKQEPVNVDWSAPDLKPIASRLPSVPNPERSREGSVGPQYFIPLSDISHNPDNYFNREVVTRGLVTDGCSRSCFFLKGMDQENSVSVPVAPYLSSQEPLYGDGPWALTGLVGKYLEVRGTLERLPLERGANGAYQLKISSYKILSSHEQKTKSFVLEYWNRRWRLVPDINPPGSELTLDVNQGDTVVLRLLRSFSGGLTSFDIDTYGVHAVFQGTGMEEKKVSFTADRAGLFPIVSHYSSQIGRIGLLIVR